jgi:hypothetical protein
MRKRDHRMTVSRLIAGVALLHVMLALALFTAGRSGIAPGIVDRNGVVKAIDVDSFTYREQAAALAAVLKERGFGAWRAEAGTAPLHVRLLSWQFRVFSPVAGDSTLAAEPWNLLCFVAIVSLVFAIARECGGGRSSLFAAAAVALWPSLLFHTLQFLKDPPFIAGTLALILLITTWLTRHYEPRHAFAAAVLWISAASILLRIRSKFAIVVFALAAFGLILLVVRQLTERRVLFWNLSCALAVAAAASLMLSQSTHRYERLKAYPSPVTGEPKALAGGLARLPTGIGWRPARTSPLLAAADDASLALGSARTRYNLVSVLGGSGIDTSVELRSASDVVAYLPRALAIGLWAPFPAMWRQPGRVTGSAARLAAGAETFAMYCFELLAIAGVFLAPRRLAALLLLVIATFGVTTLALVVSNVGTLYRFRYPFWALFIAAGMTGGAKLLRGRSNVRAGAAVVSCVALLTASCAKPAHDENGWRVAITNDTGWKIRAVYISPAGAPTWEENILGRTILDNNDTIAIRFPPAARSTRWDLRVDGAGPYCAEWKRLDLANLSSVTLGIGMGVVVAELQPSPSRARR